MGVQVELLSNFGCSITPSNVDVFLMAPLWIASLIYTYSRFVGWNFGLTQIKIVIGRNGGCIGYAHFIPSCKVDESSTYIFARIYTLPGYRIDLQKVERVSLKQESKSLIQSTYFVSLTFGWNPNNIFGHFILLSYFKFPLLMWVCYFIPLIVLECEDCGVLYCIVPYEK